MLLEAFDKIQKDYLTEGYTAPAEFLNTSDAEIAEAEKKFGETCKTEFNPQTKTFRTYNPKGGHIILDWEAFHKAYDKAFDKFGVLDLFDNTDPENAKMARGNWARIKDLQGSTPYEKRAIKALKMVWGVVNKNVYNSAVDQRKINDEKAKKDFIANTIYMYRRTVMKELEENSCTEARKYFEAALDNINSGKFEVSPEFTDFIKEAKNITQDESKLVIKDLFVPYQSDVSTVLFLIDGKNATAEDIYNKFGTACTVDDVRALATWNPKHPLYINVIWGKANDMTAYSIAGQNNRYCLDVYGKFFLAAVSTTEQAENWLAEKFKTAVKTGDTARALNALKAVRKNMDYHTSIKDLQGYELLSKYTDPYTAEGGKSIKLLYLTPDFSDVFEVLDSEAISLITGKEPEEIPATSILFAAVIHTYWSNNDSRVINYRSESRSYYSWNSKITAMVGLGDPTSKADTDDFLTDSHFEVLKSPSGSCIEGYGFDSWAKEESTTYAD